MGSYGLNDFLNQWDLAKLQASKRRPIRWILAVIGIALFIVAMSLISSYIVMGVLAFAAFVLMFNSILFPRFWNKYNNHESELEAIFRVAMKSGSLELGHDEIINHYPDTAEQLNYNARTLDLYEAKGFRNICMISAFATIGILIYSSVLLSHIALIIGAAVVITSASVAALGFHLRVKADQVDLDAILTRDASIVNLAQQKLESVDYVKAQLESSRDCFNLSIALSVLPSSSLDIAVPSANEQEQGAEIKLVPEQDASGPRMLLTSEHSQFPRSYVGKQISGPEPPFHCSDPGVTNRS